MSRVFVVQDQMHLDPASNILKPKFDMSSAARHGALITLLSPTARPFRPEYVIAELRQKLADFCDDDYLLLIGNPCLIGFCVAIAARANSGRVRVLQWDGRQRAYVVVEASLWPE
jgi:hypothetical protein